MNDKNKFKSKIFEKEYLDKAYVASYIAEFNANPLYDSAVAAICKELDLDKPEITFNDVMTSNPYLIAGLIYDHDTDKISLPNQFHNEPEVLLFCLAYALRTKAFHKYEKEYLHTKSMQNECAAYALYRLHEIPHIPDVIRRTFLRYCSPDQVKDILDEYKRKLNWRYGCEMNEP